MTTEAVQQAQEPDKKFHHVIHTPWANDFGDDSTPKSIIKVQPLHELVDVATNLKSPECLTV
jgi:hypothetical protein